MDYENSKNPFRERKEQIAKWRIYSIEDIQESTEVLGLAMHLNKLQIILTDNNQNALFLCIRDLVENGLVLERFTNEDSIPSRQDITQYIAAWFKYVELSSVACHEWMTEYCSSVLSAISSSSQSRIRHSTKCNIKYIYKSDVTFNCMCEKNRFKARCEQSCPVYEEMSHKAAENEAISIAESYEIRAEHRAKYETAPIRYSIKDQYKEQFKKAMEVAQHHLEQGTHKNAIVDLLNDGEYKTRTGKKWSYSILSNELKKLKTNIDVVDAKKIRDKSP